MEIEAMKIVKNFLLCCVLQQMDSMVHSSNIKHKKSIIIE